VDGNENQQTSALDILTKATDCCEEVQLHILTQPQIVAKILQTKRGVLVWNLSQHPDAKLHFPMQEFMELYTEVQHSHEARKFSWDCAYFTICDTDAASTRELSKPFAESLWWRLHTVLEGASNTALCLFLQ
jgi:hypothetical protein